MHPVVCIFDNSTGPKLIRADFLDEGWLGDIVQRDMSEYRGASDKKLVVSETFNRHHCMGECRT